MTNTRWPTGWNLAKLLHNMSLKITMMPYTYCHSQLLSVTSYLDLACHVLYTQISRWQHTQIDVVVLSKAATLYDTEDYNGSILILSFQLLSATSYVASYNIADIMRTHAHIRRTTTNYATELYRATAAIIKHQNSAWSFRAQVINQCTTALMHNARAISPCSMYARYYSIVSQPSHDPGAHCVADTIQLWWTPAN
jgi:hypothetical protein